MNTETTLKYCEAEIKTEIERMERELKGLPEGKIRVRHKDGVCYYSKAMGKQEQRLSRGSKEIELLLRKRFLQKSLRIRREEYRVLESAIKTVERIQENYVTPHRVAEEIKKMQGVSSQKIIFPPIESVRHPNEVIPKSFKEDKKPYKTNGGVSVRSKSEMLIGNWLEDNGIPYQYEAALSIEGEIVRPDFKVVTQQGKLKFIEHLGLWDDPNNPEYKQKNIQKVVLLSKAGLMIGDDLLLTLEKDVSSAKTIEKALLPFLVS